MGITVAQALKFGGLTQGVLLAGEKGLNNTIERVSVVEVPIDPGWVIKNSLFITTFYAVKEQPENQLRTIEVLADRGCSALVFQPRILDDLPDFLICRADELGLPLIQVAREVSYPQIITPLVGAILEEKSYLLQRSEEIHRRLTDLCLLGGGVQSIASALGDLIGRPAAIVNSWGRIIASSQLDEKVIEQMVWTRYSDFAKQATFTQPEFLPEHGVWMMKLFSGPQRNSDGFILVIDPERILEPLDLVAIEQASIVTALEIVKNRAVLETERRMQRDFFEEILNKGLDATDVILSRADALGWDLLNRRIVGLVSAENLGANQNSRHPVGSDLRGEDLKNRLLDTVAEAMKEHDPRGIVVEQGSNIILLPYCQDGGSNAQIVEHLQTLAEAVLSRVKPWIGEINVVIAFGGFHDTVQDLRTGYAEAKLALDISQKLGLRQQITWYDDVGLYVLLDRIANQPETAAWFDKMLGQLTRYDQDNGTDLVHTLEVYFDANQVIQQAAYHLFIHPKTLRYRLSRIESILETNPFAGEKQLSYYLAAKLARLLLI